ncbi:MAG: transcription antitermination factor NusB [Actinomycetota bacterium]|nr:transcription antitermination factor NusB [Actinomycetota bacterium]
MPQRRGARKLALDVLYESEMTGHSPSEVLARYTDNPGYGFASELVMGVDADRAELDRLIGLWAKDWKIERMPVIDRTLLRIGIFELTHESVPMAVAINEAVELARIYSTEDSSRFVNGVLSGIAGDALQQPSGS